MPRLRRVSPRDPGWTRRRAGKGFVYLDESGKRLEAEQIQRCKLLVIPRNELQSVHQTELSMMPEGLLQAISEDEVRDLLAYLRSPAQVPLPAGQ